MCDLFGGPSAAEKSSLQRQTAISNAMWSNFQQQYQQQQGALKNLQAEIGRIQSGQTGPGFGGAENAARIALIQNTSAAQARNAIQAVRSRGAGVAGGAGGAGTVPGAAAGIGAQTDAAIQAQVGANEANQLIAEQGENFAQGRTNAERTAAGLSQLAGLYSPTQYGSEAESANAQNFSMADKINQENIAKTQAEIGFGTKLALGAATFGAGGIGALGAGESFGEGASDFLHGGLNALSGSDQFSINR